MPMDQPAIARQAAEVERECGAASSSLDLHLALLTALERPDIAVDLATALGWEATILGLDYNEVKGAKGKQIISHEPRDVFRGYEFVEPRLPPAADSYIAHRIDCCTAASAEARFADFLWTRTKQIDWATRAVAAHARAVQVMVGAPEDRYSEAAESACRAVLLARSLRLDTLVPHEAALDLIRRALQAGHAGYVAQVMVAVAPNLAAGTTDAKQLLFDLNRAADSVAARGGTGRLVERRYIEALISLAAELKAPDTLGAARRRMVESFEREAEERSGEGALIQLASLQDALSLASTYGFKDQISRLKPKLASAATRSRKELKQFEVTVPLDVDALRQETLENARAVNEKLGPTAYLIFLGLDRRLWPDWSEVKAKTQERARAHALSSLAEHHVLGPDDQPMPAPDDPDKRREFDEIQAYATDVQLYLGLALIRIGFLRSAGEWSAALVLRTLSEGVILQGETLARIAPAVTAFEEGRAWEALHVLIPQIERCIRTVARHLGVDVTAFDKATARLRWTTLGEILSKEVMRPFLDRFGPSFGFELSVLLDHPYGLNLRNNVAHGVVELSSNVESYALLCLLILLALANVRLKAASQPSVEPPRVLHEKPPPVPTRRGPQTRGRSPRGRNRGGKK